MILVCPVTRIKAAEQILVLKPEKVEISGGEEVNLDLISGATTDIIEGSFSVISNSTYLNLVSVTSKTAEITEKNNKVTFKAKGISKGKIIATITYKTHDTAPTVSAKINVGSIFVTLTNKEEKMVENISSTISVIAGKVKNTDATLKSLSATNVDIPFKPDVMEYTMTVKNEIKKLHVEAVGVAETSSVHIGSQILQEGKNQIDITVTAENGDKKVYKLFVTREEGQKQDVKIKGQDKSKMYILLFVSILIIVIDIIYLIQKKIRG